MAALLTWLAGALANLLGYQVLRFGAWKLLLWTMGISLFPIMISHVMFEVLDTILTMTNNQVEGAGLTAGILHLTGLAAWLATQLRLVESLTMILSAVSFRLGIRMIPFIRA